jgi:hypothetical protein
MIVTDDQHDVGQALLGIGQALLGIGQRLLG